MKEGLIQRLQALDGVTVAPWKDTQLICVFYQGRDFAHFHGNDILDIRLSAEIIREEGLARDVSAKIHPKRSQNSRWIGVAFNSAADVDKIVHLVTRACAELG